MIPFVIRRILSYTVVSNFGYHIFILLAHCETTSNNGKKKTFNVDFLAQNFNIKLICFGVSLSCVAFFSPYLHITKIQLFSLFEELTVSFPACMKMTLIAFLLQVYALICKQTPIFHKPASFRKCFLLLLLSNALKFLLVREVLQIHGKTGGVGLQTDVYCFTDYNSLLYNISP